MGIAERDRRNSQKEYRARALIVYLIAFGIRVLSTLVLRFRYCESEKKRWNGGEPSSPKPSFSIYCSVMVTYVTAQVEVGFPEPPLFR